MFVTLLLLQAEDASKAAVSTYLIDQADGQVAYGTYRVGGQNQNANATGHAGTLARPPKSVNFDITNDSDNYIDTLRRNGAFSSPSGNGFISFLPVTIF